MCTYLHVYIYWHGELTIENRWHRYAAGAGSADCTALPIGTYCGR